MTRVVLASTSPYRRALMETLGVPFEAVRPPFDEEGAKATLPADPVARSLALARGKARSVQQLLGDPNALILGSDQIVEVDGVLLDKPGTRDGATAQLMRLQGRTHRIVTSVVLVRGDTMTEATDLHRLTMRTLSSAELEAYVELDQPLDCAGSYKLEAHGRALFTRIEGTDETAIVGLPLGIVKGWLEAHGIPCVHFASQR